MKTAAASENRGQTAALPRVYFFNFYDFSFAVARFRGRGRGWGVIIFDFIHLSIYPFPPDIKFDGLHRCSIARRMEIYLICCKVEKIKHDIFTNPTPTQWRYRLVYAL